MASRLAFLGPAGTYSEQAAIAHDPAATLVPFTSIPDRQTKAEDTTFFGKNLGHIPWNMNIMANNEFLKKNPAAHALFKVVRIPIEDVSAQNKLIYEGETSPEDIKRHTDAWIAKHRSAYDGYLKAARDAAAK